MKKLLIVVVIIVIAFLGYNFFKGSTPTNTPSTTDNSSNTNTTDNTTKKPSVIETKTDAKLLERLGSVSVSVSEDGGKVNLVKGSATFSVVDTKVKSSVAIGSTATEKTVGTRKDVIAFINLNSGDVMSQYLILFEDTGSALNQKSIAYVGQGLDIRGIVATDLGADSGKDYVVSVSALTQKPGVTSTVIIPVKNGSFEPSNTVSF